MRPAPAPTTTNEPPAGAGVTAFEGARLIVGDGTDPIDNATFLVRDGRITQVGRAGEVQVPEGATRVALAGKTVMPAIIDTHIHARSQMRETLIEDLQRRAYYGVAAAMSLGQDVGEVPYQVRGEVIPNAARFRTRGPRHHHAREGPDGSAVLGVAPRRKPAKRCRRTPR